ncbi:unnamed protein product [marine sediment metagenome]|uniref:Uncharacterized protein n=1 Tax=marine sediment metagenome TaxID=412755 RepID=X1KFW6_9ZZZZ
MSRTIVVNSAVHLNKERHSKVESKIQEKFPDDRILILPPEFSIQVIPKE